MTIEEAMAHAGYHSICEVEDRAKQMMPHYLFMEGDEKHREGFCTGCETWVACSKDAMKGQPLWVQQDPYLEDCGDEPEFIPGRANYYELDFQRHCTGRAMHNATGYCPNCGERVTFKHEGRGHKGLYDRRFFVRWKRSVRDPMTLVCMGYDVFIGWKNFDMLDPEVPIEATLREICVIPWGKRGDRFILDSQWCGIGGYDYKWRRRKEVKSGWKPGVSMGRGLQVVLDNRSYLDAVEGTPWKRVLENREIMAGNLAAWYDRVELLSMISGNPCVEYLCKLGQQELAARVIDRETEGMLNLRGKTAKAVLRLTDGQWGEVKGKHLSLTIDALKCRIMCMEEHVRLNMEAICWMGAQRAHRTAREIWEANPEADMARVVKYCMRKGVRLYEWRDHLRMMIELSMEMNDNEWLYPKDFSASHQMLSDRVNLIRMEQEQEKNKEKNRRICERLESGELDEYFFAANGLVLRPMLSAAEIVIEGSRQGHCVGGYVDTYANGNDVLCVLRHEDRMGEPLYTVEFGKDGKLVQCRAKRNGEGPLSREERDTFWKLHDMMRRDMRAQKARGEKRRKSA